MTDTPMSVDPATLDDERARERALDPRASIILQAPAGSGKTTVLTQRFLRVLAEVDEPEEVLAITFTRKAAAEMRRRIILALRATEHDGTEQGRRLASLAEAVRRRSRERGWLLESSPARLRVQTIDSLNRWLASRLPVSARAVGDLAVIERPDPLYRRAARRALVDAEGDPELQPHAGKIFQRLDNDFVRLERLLTEMLRVRSHWLPRILGHDAPGLRARIEESLAAIIDERLRFARSLVPASLRREGARLAAAAARHRDAERLEPLAAAADSDDLSLPVWRALASMALTGEGSWRAVLTKREGFPTTDKALKAAGLQWIQDMSSLDGAQELLGELAALPDRELDAEDADTLESLARILYLAVSELELVFREGARVDYPYVAAAARRALTEEGAPTDLGLRLGGRIRHILVDEFQDTSIDQIALLEALTAQWEPGDGRTLFVVGDPMQSIYQFREAEVGLFLRARTRGIGNVALEPLTLTHNFRAAPPVVEWTNASFRSIFPARDDARASAVSYLACVASREDREDRSGVRLHCTDGADPGGEARLIASTIVEIRAREPGASVAVLISSRSHAAPIVAALGEVRMPVAGVELVSLAELPIVRDLAALARALDHLADRTAWLAVLRAPWCGLSLRDLSTLLEDAPPSMLIRDAVADTSRIARLGPESRMRLERTRTALERALAERGRADPARTVENAWLRLGGPSCAAEEDLVHAEEFFRALAEWSTEPGWTGPLSLDERLLDLYATHQDAPADAVQIMTVHRAKGLEFDKVFVPGLGRTLRNDAEPLLRWLELPREPRDSDLLMAPITQVGRRAQALNAYMKSLRQRRLAHERTRLIYVAATRARSELHLFGSLQAPSDAGGPCMPRSGSLLSTLWPAVRDRFPQRPGTPTIELAPASDSASPAKSQAAFETASGATCYRLPADWQIPPPPAGPAVSQLDVASEEAGVGRSFPWASDLERFVDEAVLEVMRRLARRPEPPQEKQVFATRRALEDRLSARGLAEGELEQAVGQALHVLVACAHEASFQRLWSPAYSDASGGVELSGLQERRLEASRIDRTFIDEAGDRWVVLFAPGAPEGDHDEFALRELARYRADLARCRAFVSRPAGKSVRAALYFPRWKRLLERRE